MSVRIAFVLAALVLASHSVLLRADPVQVMGSYSGPNWFDGQREADSGESLGCCTRTEWVAVSCCYTPPGSVGATGVLQGFTLGPVRPGLMTLLIDGFWDTDSRDATGSVSGSVVSLADPSHPVTLYSWNFPVPENSWISQTATFPIELGTSFDVNLSASIKVGTGDDAGGALIDQVQISAADVPEPAALGLVCSGLATCYLLRKRARGTNA